MKRDPMTLDPWNCLAAWLLPEEPKTEKQIIAARIASHQKWARRRAMLRLWAFLRGRPKRRAGKHRDRVVA